MLLNYSPQKRIIGTAQVCEKTNISPRTLNRLLKKGQFPKPFFQPGVRKRCWFESIIDQHLDESAETSEDQAA